MLIRMMRPNKRILTRIRKMKIDSKAEGIRELVEMKMRIFHPLLIRLSTLLLKEREETLRGVALRRRTMTLS